jgi:hypothetical protein
VNDGIHHHFSFAEISPSTGRRLAPNSADEKSRKVFDPSRIAARLNQTAPVDPA